MKKIAIATFLLALAGCGSRGGEEIARLNSPDSLVDAILMRKDTDATVASPYEIYIVPAGAKPTGEPSLRGDKFDGLKLEWKEPRFLRIHYSKGRIFAFTNFWQSMEIKNGSYTVELRLIPTSDSFSM